MFDWMKPRLLNFNDNFLSIYSYFFLHFFHFLWWSLFKLFTTAQGGTFFLSIQFLNDERFPIVLLLLLTRSIVLHHLGLKYATRNYFSFEYFHVFWFLDACNQDGIQKLFLFVRRVGNKLAIDNELEVNCTLTRKYYHTHQYQISDWTVTPFHVYLRPCCHRYTSSPLDEVTDNLLCYKFRLFHRASIHNILGFHWLGLAIWQHACHKKLR